MTPPPSGAETAVEITVDGTAVAAVPGEMLIAACERNGAYIPRFCYHPRMTPVGMCRMCLVEVDTGRGFDLQPSCMVPVTEGMKVSTESAAAKKAQDGVLEFLLVNHPLDCPVCDKGGECPLQDQTMAYGPGETRFVEEKRHFPKPIAISETVYLDRERCILCDRCTRFADEVAGDALIQFMGRGNLTEVNTYPNEPFSSYFSGNTVQICPVGALTAVPYRFKARPWDLTETLSTAWVDSVGSRVSVQASRNRVLRVLGADADAVNWGWLSDKERFGFEALNSDERLAAPMVRGAVGDERAELDECAELREAGWGEALDRVTAALAATSPQRVAVLGGARLTNEAQYMWAKLAKGVIGTDNVDAQLGDGPDPGLVLGLPRATIDDACRPGGTVLLIGPDPKEELGSFYLRLRHAIANLEEEQRVKLIEVTPRATGLSHLARHSLRPKPGTTAYLVWCLMVRALSGADDMGAQIEAVTLLDTDVADAAGVDMDEFARAAELIGRAGDALTVVLGQASLAEPLGAVAEAASLPLATTAGSLKARFLPALRRGNLRGALEAGLAPGLLPGRVPLAGSAPRFEDLLTRPAPQPEAEQRDQHGEARQSGAADAHLDLGAVEPVTASGPAVPAESARALIAEHWPRLPEGVGLDACGTLEAAAAGDIDVLMLVGSDPLNDFIDRDLACRGLSGARLVVAVDLFVNDSARLAANVVLPAAGPTECDGTFVNLEGRVSVMARKVTPPGTARPDWMIAAAIAERIEPGSCAGLDSPEAIRAELRAVAAVYRSVTEEALAAAPVEGVLLDGPAPLVPTLGVGACPDRPPGSDRQAGPSPRRAGPAGREDLGAAGREDRREDPGDLGEDRLFRLVATRTMYDDGVMLRSCASSRRLAPAPTARINPADLDLVGVDHGAAVRVVSQKGRHVDASLVADGGVPPGSLAVNWLAPGAPANTLITAGEPVAVVTVEAL